MSWTRWGSWGTNPLRAQFLLLDHALLTRRDKLTGPLELQRHPREKVMVLKQSERSREVFLEEKASELRIKRWIKGMGKEGNIHFRHWVESTCYMLGTKNNLVLRKLSVLVSLDAHLQPTLVILFLFPLLSLLLLVCQVLVWVPSQEQFPMASQRTSAPTINL